MTQTLTELLDVTPQQRELIDRLDLFQAPYLEKRMLEQGDVDSPQ